MAESDINIHIKQSHEIYLGEEGCQMENKVACPLYCTGLFAKLDNTLITGTTEEKTTASNLLATLIHRDGIKIANNLIQKKAVA